MSQIDFLPFAVGGEANVLAQDAYAELPAVADGFPKGILPSAQVNKVLRQSSVMAAAIARLIAARTDEDVLDDGDVDALSAKIASMIVTIVIESAGSLNWQGTWDASANSPELVSGAGTKGFYYTVNVAGSTDLDGIDQWSIGDKAAFNGTSWEKIEGQPEEVISVAGRIGVVVLAAADISDSSALGRSVMQAIDAAAARALLELGTAATQDSGDFDAAGAAAAAQAASDPTGSAATAQAAAIAAAATDATTKANAAQATAISTASADATTKANAAQAAAIAASRSATKQQPIGVACSDETTALTTGDAKVTFHLPIPFTVTGVMVELVTPQASGSIFTVDVDAAGSSILSTKATIDNTEETSLSAATPPVVSGAPLALAAGTKVQFNIDQVGDGTAKGLKGWLLGYPT